MKTRDDVHRLVNEVFARVHEVRHKAQDEYAHDDSNALANFERLAKELGISREMVLWVYLRKHLDGIASWIRGFKSQRENVRGRILDSILYQILLWAMADDTDQAVGTASAQIDDDFRFDQASVLIPAREFLERYSPKGEYGTLVIETTEFQVLIRRVHPHREALES